MMAEFLFRLIISDTDIRKVKLSEKPADVQQLNSVIREKTGIVTDFLLLYEDRDFNNDLVSLTDIEELQPFGTVRMVEVHTQEQEVMGKENDASLANVSHSDTDSSMRQGNGWPQEFVIPKFDLDVDMLLEAGNAEYAKTGKLLNLSKSAKGAVLKKLAVSMYEIKAYPTEAECTSVACALVTKYPSLREPGSVCGYGGWRNSIQFKMGSYRNDLRRAGGAEVSVNAGKKSIFQPNLLSSRKGIKKPKRSEANFLPNLPAGETTDSQEAMRQTMVDEYSKAHKDRQLIKSLMMKTFASRRQTVVNNPARISVLLEDWPGLFDPTQVLSFLLFLVLLAFKQ